MMKKTFRLTIFAALSAIVMVACQKETDESIAGPQGPQGPEGPAGPPGPKGDTGVANVIYSEWTDVLFSQEDEESYFEAGIPAPRLTKDILDKGVVKVYFNLNTEEEPVIVSLPFVDFDLQVSIQPYILEGGIYLLANFDASTALDINNRKVQQYRYVIIPGGVLGVKPSDVNLDNYAEAQKYLKLK